MNLIPLEYKPGRSIAVERILLIAKTGETRGVICQLQQRFPGAIIEIAGRKGSQNSDVTHLLPRFPLRRHMRDLRKTARWVAWCRRLRRARFDLVVNLDSRLSSAMLAYASAAPIRVGVPLPAKGEKGMPFQPYTHPFPAEWLVTLPEQASVPPSVPQSSGRSW